MAQLLLGPILRYVGEESATIWVECDSSCQVEVRVDDGAGGRVAHRARTFAVQGHHYALVVLEDLPSRATLPYEVALDGETPCWPEPGSKFPPSVIRTRNTDQPLRIAFGSCHLSAPHEPPHTLRAEQDPEGKEVDALYALAMDMVEDRPGAWPDLLLFLGDQVYADDLSPGARAFIARRPAAERNGAPPDEAADFEEYVRLYWDTWRDATQRWVMSTVPSAMIFDDHDVHDDWNTSDTWVRSMRRTSWWHERIVAAFMSYWVYQHLGNLSPADLRDDPLWSRVRDETGDAEPLLREMAEQADADTDGARWSYCRDIGRVRLVMVDSRAGRMLDGRRRMLDDAEWDWVAQHARGDVDHLLIGTSLPYLLAPGMHYLEAWNERVCAGAWGRPMAWAGERLRQALDLEHWGAFEESFVELTELLAEVGAGRRGQAPASIVVLSGDVHHAYVAETAFPREAGVTAPIYQAVCSPFRNPLNKRERRVIRAIASRPAHAAMRLLARTAGVGDPAIRWRYADPPVFDNQVAWLSLQGRRAELRIAKTTPDDAPHPRLHFGEARVLAA